MSWVESLNTSAIKSLESVHPPFTLLSEVQGTIYCGKIRYIGGLLRVSNLIYIEEPAVMS